MTLPVTAVTSPQPITINNTNNICPEKPKDKGGGGYAPGTLLYCAIEGLGNYWMISQKNSHHAPDYLIGAVAGAAFGFYKAIQGDRTVGIEGRASAFGKSSTGDRLMMIGEILLAAPVLQEIEDRTVKSLIPNVSGLVSFWWGFSAGKDTVRFISNNIISEKPQSKEK